MLPPVQPRAEQIWTVADRTGFLVRPARHGLVVVPHRAERVSVLPCLTYPSPIQSHLPGPDELALLVLREDEMEAIGRALRARQLDGCIMYYRPIDS